MRLDIRMICAKKLLGAVNRKLLYLVGIFLPTVIATPRIPFGVFVRKHTPKSMKYIFGHIVFTRNQLDTMLLSLFFRLYKIIDFFVYHPWNPRYTYYKLV